MFNTETRLAPKISKNQTPSLQVAWYFPNTYEIGMSGLGYQLVWWLMEQDPEINVRRCFLDIKEPGRAASDLIGFTVSWELDFANIIRLLKEEGIPLSRKERLELAQSGVELPIIFGGGPVLTANPEPFHDLFDVILLGDAETSVPSLVESLKESKRSGLSLIDSDEILNRLAKIPGLYVPSRYIVSYDKGSGDKRSDFATIKSIDPIDSSIPPVVQRQNFSPPKEYAVHTQILSSATTWSDRFLIEVVRSCPQECRFCLASYLTRPFRATDVDTMMQAIEEALQVTNKIGLLGPSVTEHPLFDKLAARLKDRHEIDLSIASVRADSLNDEVLAVLRGLGQKSLTIAIESGSERLRGIMKKNLSTEEIEAAVAKIEKAGFEGIKFYGIAGLPFEVQEDLDETIKLMQKLKKAHKRMRFVFGVSSFVPKAQTPFQWYGRDRAAGKKLEYLRKNLAKLGIEVRPESHNWSDIQALISRGDRRLSQVIKEVSTEGENLGAWKRVLRNLPEDIPDLDFYAFREIPKDELLPWSHLTEKSKADNLLRQAGEAEKLSLD
ncbi:MAG: radical SAM protein [Candidatus Obscuribacter phosphatis]|uniref:Radical SAM protein n=1 Tax=Candidatus Obscuribacter phosphatis TaxID=1906157 RepID=A0A8J7P721_9BACT|nr:radical SAM protein [Candidatus Obscuribacter phosphatis]